MFFLYPLPCFAAQFSLRPAQYLDAYNRLTRMSNPRNNTWVIHECFCVVFYMYTVNLQEEWGAKIPYSFTNSICAVAQG